MSKQLVIVLAFAGLLAATVVAAANSPGLVGGIENELPADDEVTQVVNAIQPEVEKLSNTKFRSLQPLSYRRQLVAGTNYFVKVLATNNEGQQSHFHLRIYKPFSTPLQLTALRANVDSNHPLEYFQ